LCYSTLGIHITGAELSSAPVWGIHITGAELSSAPVWGFGGKRGMLVLGIYLENFPKVNFQNNLAQTTALTPKPPEGGFNSRLRVLKPPSGGLGVSAGMLVFGGSYFESFTKAVYCIFLSI
jgi:hypothetical protein